MTRCLVKKNWLAKWVYRSGIQNRGQDRRCEFGKHLRPVCSLLDLFVVMDPCLVKQKSVYDRKFPPELGTWGWKKEGGSQSLRQAPSYVGAKCKRFPNVTSLSVYISLLIFSVFRFILLHRLCMLSITVLRLFWIFFCPEACVLFLFPPYFAL